MDCLWNQSANTMFVDLFPLLSMILLQAGFDLKEHFKTEFFAQIFSALVMVVQGLAVKPSLVGNTTFCRFIFFGSFISQTNQVLTVTF